MAQIYGELIRAQLQSATNLTIGANAAGLIYLHTGDNKLTVYDGAAWQKLVTEAALTSSLSGKVDANAAITGATKTKITYDSKGLVTAGEDLAAEDIPTGIDATKIGTGNVNNLKFGKLNTAGSNGPDLLVNTDGTQNLWNKTLIECKVDNFSDFAEETSSQVAPGSGYLRLYAKNDHKIYKIWDGGVETEIGAGGSGTGRNYLQDWFDGNKQITVSATTLAATANRTTDTTLWARSTVAGLTIANNAINPLRQAGDFLIDSSATTINSFVESPLWTLDVADLGKPLSIEFDLTGIAANTSYDVVVVRYNNTGTYQETISVAGNASTGTPASAQLPTGTVKFRGFYVPSSTSNDQYALRLRKVAAVDDDFQIDSIFVGPQSLAQGAVVTQWQTYIPTITGTTTNPTKGSIVRDIAYWRRVGTNIELRYEYRQNTAGSSGSGSYVISIPTGLTIDSNYVQSPLGANQTQSIGTFAAQGASAYSGNVIALTTAGVSLEFNGSTLGSGDLNLGNSNVRIGLSCSIPISQWSSGTTTLADRAVEEYAWNSDPGVSAGTTYSTTSYYGNGPQGTPVLSVNSTTNTGESKTFYNVQFQTPVLPTDSVFLEFNDGNGWFNAGNRFAPTTNNAASYGPNLIAISSTVYRVGFGNAGYGTAGAATYGANGGAWSALSGWKWRVRKVSGGAAVGFPVSARNIVGDTSGTAVPSGYVGEVVNTTSAIAQTSAGAGATVDVTNATLTLGAGVWRICYRASIQTASANNEARVWLSLNDNTRLNNSGSSVFSASGLAIMTCAGEAIVSIQSSTTYKLRLYSQAATGYVNNYADGRDSVIYAIRIA